MKQYETYKDSGVEWIGVLPEHWRVIKLKFVTEYVKTGSTPPSDNLEYYSNGNIDWYGPSDFKTLELGDSKKKVTQKALIDGKCRLFDEGSVLLIGIGATVGKIGITNRKCSSNQQINAIKFKSDLMISTFATYYLDSIKNIIVSEAASSTLPIFNQTQTKELAISHPSLKEQNQIANYLNQKTAQLDTLIAKKEQLISLLQEERTAIIDNFLQPKDDWNSVPIRYLIMGGYLKQQDGNHGELHPIASEYTENGIPFVMANHLVNEKIDFENCKYISEERASKLRIGFAKEGDILLTHKGTLGRVAIVEGLSTEYVMLTPQVTYYRCLKGLDNRYLKLFFQSSKFQNEMKFIGGEGTTRAYVGLLAQRNIVIDFPNEINEQKKIVEKIDFILNINSDLINKFSLEIELLKEYKNALISEVVTGKVDVREEVLVQ